MAEAQTAAAEMVRPITPAFVMRLFYAFATLAFLSLAISVAGKWLGSSIAMAGHTDDRTIREIVIGNNVLSIPSNAIRFERARQSGIALRVDLYLRWPDLEGYSNAHRAAFNHEGGSRDIVFLTFEERMTSRDMSGRYAPIYSSLVLGDSTPGPGGLEIHGFKPDSGYVDEVLAVGTRSGDDPFVARCLVGPSGENSLAPCERDVHLGDNLSLVYRFPAHLLKDWRTVDAAIMAKAIGYLQTGR